MEKAGESWQLHSLRCSSTSKTPFVQFKRRRLFKLFKLEKQQRSHLMFYSLFVMFYSSFFILSY